MSKKLKRKKEKKPCRHHPARLEVAPRLHASEARRASGLYGEEAIVAALDDASREDCTCWCDGHRPKCPSGNPVVCGKCDLEWSPPDPGDDYVEEVGPFVLCVGERLMQKFPGVFQIHAY